MNHITILSLSFLFLVGCMAPGYIVTDKSQMEKSYIFEAPDKSKGELFKRANTWMVKVFNSAESVIEYSDKEEGLIMGKYIHIIPDGLRNLHCKTTVRIDIKDDKVRMQFTDPWLIGMSSGGSMSPQNRPVNYSNHLGALKLKWNALASNLQEHLKKEDENW